MRRVSVCIASYNGEKYIKAQIQSILTQLSIEDEIIISDDSSTDCTISVIKELDDKRIKLFENQLFRSPMRNFEHAIKQAQGQYIFLADQDDIWLPGKVGRILESFDAGFNLVMSNCWIVDKDLTKEELSFFERNRSAKGVIKNLIKNSYMGCCMAFKADLLSILLPFPKKIPLHDIWIGMVGELTMKVNFLDEKLILYRKHGENVSNSGGNSRFGLIEKISFRWNTIRYIPLIYKRYLKYRKAPIYSLI